MFSGRNKSDDYLNWLINHKNNKETLAKTLRSRLINFANTHLNKIGTKNNYTNKQEKVNIKGENTLLTDISDKKTQAINLLIDLTESASTDQIYQYIVSPNFQKMINTNRILNITQPDNMINNFVKKYKEFQNKYNLNRLKKYLSNKIYFIRHIDVIGDLFLYYDPHLIADLVVNIHGINDLNVYCDGLEITTEFLARFLHDEPEIINEINLFRKNKCLSQILPEGAILPGLNMYDNHTLNVYDLFQYDENTILAVEQYLRDNFHHVLCNQITEYDKSYLDNNLPHNFYLISSATYMLLDPDQINDQNYYRYENFKNDILSLLASADNDDIKPVIFCGIINIDNSHYLTYFIHKHINDDKVQIWTVDPSPLVSTSDITLNSKWQTREKCKKAFSSIFKKVDFSDAEITQMSRERDCGPCSASTLFDAFISSSSDTPLVFIKNGKLIFNRQKLAIAHDPVGFDHYKKKYVYSEELFYQAKLNREQWRKRLNKIKIIKPPVAPTRDNDNSLPSIDDLYETDENFFIDYNYDYLAIQQESQDAKEVNISAVYSMLQSTSYGHEVIFNIITNYHHDTSFSGAREIVRFLKFHVHPKDVLYDLASAHNNNFKALAKDVIGIILDNHIPEMLEQNFEKTILKNLPEDMSLVPEELANSFLDHNEKLYIHLSSQQKLITKMQLINLAKPVVESKLTELHFQIINDHSEKYFRHYMSFISNCNQNELGSILVEVAIKDNSPSNKFFQDSIQFLALHAASRLAVLVNEKIQIIMQNMTRATIEHLKKNVLHANVPLETLISEFFEGGHILTIDKAMMKSILFKYTNDNASVLSINEVNTWLGEVILAAVNKQIPQMLNTLIWINFKKIIIESGITQNFYKLLPKDFKPSYLIASLKTDNFSGEFSQSRLNDFILENTNNTEIVDYFNHPYLTKIFHECLQQMIKDYLEDEMRSHYQRHAVALFSANNFYLLSNKTIELFAENDSDEICGFLINDWLSSDHKTNELSVFRDDFFYAGKLNNAGNHFLNWLSRYVKTNIQPNCNKFQLIMDNLDNVIASFDMINLKIAKHKPDLEFHEFIDKLLYIKNEIKSIALFDEKLKTNKEISNYFSCQFEKFSKSILSIIQHACKYLFNKYYLSGNFNPGSMTTFLRPYFCNLLNISTKFIVKKREIARLDELIRQTISSCISMNFFKINHQPTLIILQQQKNLDAVYQMPLTTEILIQCIQFWLTKSDTLYTYRKDAQARAEKFIEFLIDLVNQSTGYQLSDECPIDVLQSLRSMIFYYENEKVDENLKKVMMALLSTSSLSLYKHTKLEFGELGKFLFPDKTLGKNHQFPEYRNFTQDVWNVKSCELKRSSWCRFMNMDTPRIKKLLLQIQDKHDGKTRFFLDDNDILCLKNLLKSRWHDRCYKFGEEKAAFGYCHNPSQHDRIYIALAEILTNYYRNNNQDMLCHELLMPGNTCFLPNSLLQTTKLPSYISEAYLMEDGGHISTIPLKYLITLPDGHAIDINWILDRYESHRELHNPYTEKPLTKDEVSLICEHPLANKLLSKINFLFTPGMTQKAIKLLVDYLNGAIFTEGFSQFYTVEQNFQASQAYANFVIELNKLDILERRALLNESIPGSLHNTVYSTFYKSTSSCLTYKGILLAKVVLAYEPENHNLVNYPLVTYASEDYIPRRYYERVSTDCTKQEEMILTYIQDTTRTINTPKLYADKNFGHRRR